MVKKFYLTFSLFLFCLLLPQSTKAALENVGFHKAYGAHTPRYCEVAKAGSPVLFPLPLGTAAVNDTATMQKYKDCFDKANIIIIRITDVRADSPNSSIINAAKNASAIYKDLGTKVIFNFGNEINNIQVMYPCSDTLNKCAQKYAQQLDLFRTNLSPGSRVAGAALDLIHPNNAESIVPDIQSAYNATTDYIANVYQDSNCPYDPLRCSINSASWYSQKFDSKPVFIAEFSINHGLKPTVKEQYDFVTQRSPQVTSPNLLGFTPLILNTCKNKTRGDWLMWGINQSLYDEQGTELKPSDFSTCDASLDQSLSSSDPRQTEEFSAPLKYACDARAAREYSPLRPYPGSPCDPLIPENPKVTTPQKKIPFESTYPLSFSCGTSINTTGFYEFKSTKLDGLPLFPSDPNLAQVGQKYRCDTTQDSKICEVKNIVFNLSLNLANASIPVIGNTQDGLDDATKLNYYLSWYLNGAVEHSDGDQNTSNSTPTDIDRLINYSGPLKKLLPQEFTQNLKRNVNASAWLNASAIGFTNSGLNQLHHYYTSSPIRLGDGTNLIQNMLRFVPLSTLEDITGEVTLSIIPDQQPGHDIQDRGVKTLPDGNEVIKETNPLKPAAITLRIQRDSDPRLYFPHLRSTNYLSQVLRSIQSPKSTNPQDSIRWTNTEQPKQKITNHQGIEDSTLVYKENEYPGKPLVVTRNTEIGAPTPIITSAPWVAPDPIFSDHANWYIKQNGGPQDQRCTILDTQLLQDIPGDTLYGKQVNATLKYTQKFAYDAATPPTNGGACTVDTGCWQGNCCLKDPETAPPGLIPACSPKFTCEWRSETKAYCTAPNVPSGCGTFVQSSNIEIPTAARVAVFVKTPLVDKIYETLVSGSQSLMRRFLPSKPTEWDDQYDYIAGEVRDNGTQDLTQTRPVSSSVSTSGQVTAGTSEGLKAGGVTAGAVGADPRLYFPRLGSLADYFLGGPTEEFKNLQRLLRPKGMSSGGIGLGDGDNGGGDPIIPGNCSEGVGYCSVSSLTPVFGSNSTEASLVCQKESWGTEGIVNDYCQEGKPRYTRDYSVGLFQINLLAHPNASWLRNSPDASSLRSALSSAGYNINSTCPSTDDNAGLGFSCYCGIRELPAGSNPRYCTVTDNNLISICKSWFQDPTNNMRYAKSLSGCPNCDWCPKWSAGCACGLQ